MKYLSFVGVVGTGPEPAQISTTWEGSKHTLRWLPWLYVPSSLCWGGGALSFVFSQHHNDYQHKKKQERAPSKNKPLQMISPFLSSFNFQPRIWDIHNSRWHNSRNSRHTERRCNSTNTTLCHTLVQVNWPSRLTTPQPPCSSWMIAWKIGWLKLLSEIWVRKFEKHWNCRSCILLFAVSAVPVQSRFS